MSKGGIYYRKMARQIRGWRADVVKDGVLATGQMPSRVIEEFKALPQHLQNHVREKVEKPARVRYAKPEATRHNDG